MSTCEATAETQRCVERGRWAVWLLWLGAACSVAGLAKFVDCGDGNDYLRALNGSSSLAYSPLFMIPAVGVAKLLPLWLTVALFGVAYFSGWLTQLWVGMQCATPEERRIFRYVAPVLVFFPGLLVSDIITAGNLAYILYGLMFAGVALGWKRGNWTWFYLAVLAAACVKVHLLTMLAIPLLSGRRQWMRAVATGATGLSLYALQSLLWPQAFDAYMNSLKVMSSSQRDFGCGPVGILARVLQMWGIPHKMPCILFYGVYATALFLLLLWLSRLYRERRICFESWAPVMLTGVVLLNPRIQYYDIAAVSLPMALMAYRWLLDAEGNVRATRAIGAAIVLAGLNIFVELNEFVPMLPAAWKYTEMLIMLAVFAAGVGGLLKGRQQEAVTTGAIPLEG